MSFLSQVLGVIPVAFAQAGPLPLPTQVSSLQTSSNIISFICTVVFSWLFTIAILLSVVLVLIAAYRYLTSAGDPGKVKLATNTIIYAAIGIAVAMLARSLPFIVEQLVPGQADVNACRTTEAAIPQPPVGN